MRESFCFKLPIRSTLVRWRGLALLPCSVLLCLPWADAWAQVVPDAGSLLQQQRREPPMRPDAQRPQTPKPEPAPAATAEDETRVRVTAFRIEGRTLAFSPEKLLAVLEPWRGRTLNLAELNEAVGAVTKLYRDSGFLIARAVLPKQDVSDGLITVRVLEAALDSTDPIRVIGADTLRLRPEHARAVVAESLSPGQPLRGDELDRAVLLLNDLPGVTARLELEPGDQIGSTRVLTNVQQGPLWSGQASVDNFGSRYTGPERLGVVLDMIDPSGRGDQATLQASAAQGLSHLSTSYTWPVGYRGLRMTASLGGLNYRLGESLAPLDAGGSALDAGLLARYPMLRDAGTSVHLSAALNASRLRNHANGAQTSDKRLQVLRLGMQVDHLDQGLGGGANALALTVSTGQLDLSADAANRAQDQAGARTHGAFAKATLSLQRVQPLPIPRLSLLLSALAQAANRNLDSAEKLQLGGPNGVRAYPVGEASGDSGVRASAELRWQAGQLPQVGPVQLQAFVDGGHIRQYHNAAALQLNTPNSYGIAGWGLGAMLSGPQGTRLQIGWTQRLGNNPGRSAAGLDADGRNSKSRVWLNAAVVF